VGLDRLVGEKPTVLIFYRGSWCPYCIKHLNEIEKAYDRIAARGYQVLAVSPDKPEEIRVMQGKFSFRFRVLSDSPMAVSKAFGIAFTLDPATRKKLAGYGIDVVKASGLNHYQLPHPSVYLFDQDGKLTFRHVNPDYKVRLDPEDLLKRL